MPTNSQLQPNVDNGASRPECTTSAYFFRKWLSVCRLPNDLRNIYTTDPGRAPRWKEPLLKLMTQVVFLCGSLAVVASISQDAGEGQDIVLLSLQRALQVWPWVWLIIATVSFTASQFNRLVAAEMNKLPNLSEENRDALTQLYNQKKVTTPKVMMLASIALETVVMRVCNNLCVIVVIGGLLLIALPLYVNAFGCGSGMMILTLWGVGSGGILGMVMLRWLAYHPISDEAPWWCKFVGRLLVAFVAAHLLSWNLIVVCIGLSFVFLQLTRDWLRPSMLSFVAFGFGWQFTLAPENSGCGIVQWLKNSLHIADFLPEVVVGFILLAATGRWLKMFEEQVKNTGQVTKCGQFGFGTFVLGVPIAFGMNRLQEWMFTVLGADLSKISAEDMLALITIAVAIPSLLIWVTLRLYNLSDSDVPQTAEESKNGAKPDA